MISSLYCRHSYVCESHNMKCKSMLFVTNRIEAHFKFFFQKFPWVLQLWRFFIKWYQKEWSIKLCIENGGWQETLNLLHVSRCKMLQFVTSFMKQNKSCKQTLESAQNGLEIFIMTIKKLFASLVLIFRCKTLIQNSLFPVS